MRQRIRSIVLTMAVSAALLGCAGDEGAEDSTWESATPQGYEWAGPGEPQSFAAADQFCRRIVVNSNLRLKATLNNVQSGSDERNYPTEADLRSYWQCMEGRGWKVVRQQPVSPPE